MHDRLFNGEQLELTLEELVNGEHESCQNPQCGMPFGSYENKLIRTKGIDGRWYCDAICASGPYLVRRAS